MIVPLVRIEGVQRPPQAGHSCRVALRERRHQPVEQQIHRPRRLRWCGRGPGCVGHRTHAAGSAVASNDGRIERVEVGLPGQRRVQRGEALGGVQQHPRPLAASCPVERDPSTQQLQAGLRHGVQRPGRGDRQQLQGLGRTGLVLGVRGFQGPFRPDGRPGGQLGRALQKRRRGGQPAAGAGPAGRTLQLRGGVLISAHHRLRAVPGTPVRIDLLVGDGGQRAVRPAPVGRCGRPVDRRAHQRVPEPHTEVELQQPGGLRGRSRLAGDPQLRGRAPQQRRIPGRFGRGNHQQHPRVGRQAVRAAPKAVLDPARNAHHVRQLEPARELHRRSTPG